MTLRSWLASTAAFFFLAPLASLNAQTGSNRSLSLPEALPAIIVGFLGGYVPHDSAIHGGVQMAVHLRKEYASGAEVEVFENHRGEEAYQEILRLLDTDRDGTLTTQEKRGGRIVLYGHSWGASEAINVARRLEANDIPVLLTIQIDSVRKSKQDDSVIPSNVAKAVNFYQSAGFVHGLRQIRAADPARTHIIGNFQFDYKLHPIACTADYPWYARAFAKPHIEIECDPTIWNQIESLIRSALATGTGADRTLRRTEPDASRN